MLIRLPRVLLTNDDGFDAPGLKILADVAQLFADEIWILAPEHDLSGTSQGLTLNSPLRCWPRGERQWAVTGTPSDCVAMALSHFMADKKPSLIISGINPETNVGDEVNLSGTVGGAMMGLTLGVPSIAISQGGAKSNPERWETARVTTQKMLHHFLTHGWRKETCLSINIPNLPADEITGFSWARQAHKNLKAIEVVKTDEHRGEKYYWLGTAQQTPPHKDNSDIAILNRGEVAVSVLSLDRSLDVTEPSIIFNEEYTSSDTEA